MKALFVAGIMVAGLLAACGTSENTKASGAIRPPFKGITIPMETYTIDAARESFIRTRFGTRIRIPANALADADGSPVKGKVKLRFREFHTAADILVSGIPMRYDSAGTKYDFVSAGMFEIAAEQQGRLLKIGKDQKIDVTLASYKDDEGYSFYQLNPENGAWINKGISLSRKNEHKAAELKQFRDDNLIAFDLDYSTQPELQQFNGICWTYAGSDQQKDPLRNDWILAERWRDIKIAKLGTNGKYMVTLSNSRQRIDMEMTPYFTADQREQEQAFAARVTDYEQLVEERKNRESAIQLQADLTRSFAISEFGYYNWDKIDKIVREEQLAVVNASFTLDGKAIPETARLYHIDGKDKLLAREGSKWDKLVFRPDDNNRLLVVMPDNRVAIAGRNDFERARDKPEAVFVLHAVQRQVSSLEDVRALLAKS